MMSGRNSFPFTATQWQELEHQALIFKYMVAGMPIPSDLLFTIKRSLDSSLSSNLILHQPQQIGWNCYQMGFGRKIDPEPGRCRRTDGKKWRCSKEAYPDSKYCERHMHRGRNRSRKPVDNNNNNNTMSITSICTSISSTPPTPISCTSISSTPPISSSSSSSSIITKNTNPSSSPSYTNTNISAAAHHVHHHCFLNPHSSTRPLDNTTHLLLDPAPNYSHKDYRTNRYGHGVKEEVDHHEHVFFSETCHGQTMRSCSGSSIDDSWQLTMGGSGSTSFTTHLEQQRTCGSGLDNGYSSYSQLQGLSTDTSKHQNQDHHCFAFGTTSTDAPPLKIERDEEYPRKVMHHFFDESPPRNKDSWLDSKDRSSNHKPVSETQLSISIPNNYSHDFFTNP